MTESSTVSRLLVAIATAGVLGSIPASARAARPLDHDRQAILAMAGRYEVRFEFQETVSLRDSYSLAEPYRTGGVETVVVAVDTDRVIELQHILVLDDDTALKHWRQRWEYEGRDLLEYRGGRSFAHRKLTEQEARGTWMQAVYDVDDAPRYQGYGRWRHDGPVSSWESNDTWRPLPRREATKRSDYDVIVARNRQTLTPDGWVHEQDNLKASLEPDGLRLLARETGINRYRRTTSDHKAADAYWLGHRDFWKDVREAWRRATRARELVVEDKDANGASRFERLFELAQASAAASPYESDFWTVRIDAAIAAFVHPPRDEKTAGAPR